MTPDRASGNNRFSGAVFPHSFRHVALFGNGIRNGKCAADRVGLRGLMGRAPAAGAPKPTFRTGWANARARRADRATPTTLVPSVVFLRPP